MPDPTSRRSRAIRAAIVGVIAAQLGALGHQIGGGGPPSAGAELAVGVVVGLAAALLGGKQRGVPTIGALLLGAQAMSHLLACLWPAAGPMTAGSGYPAQRAAPNGSALLRESTTGAADHSAALLHAGHSHQAMAHAGMTATDNAVGAHGAAAMAAHPLTPAMLGWHLLAAAATAVVLARVDALAFRLAALWRLAATAPLAPVPASAALTWFPHLRWSVLRDRLALLAADPRRGPPAARLI